MTTEQSHNPNFLPGKMAPEGFRVLEKGIIYELPIPPKENVGLAAVLDIGGKMPDPTFEYGESKERSSVKESDFTMLLAVDLRVDGAEKWVEGCDIPNGATAALIDPKGMKISPDGKVNEGVTFLAPGGALIIGRGQYKEGDPQSGFRRLSVDASAVSYKHLDIAVDKSGTLAIRDRYSTNGTLVSTGEAARDAVNEIGEHHEHHMRFKRVLGEEATEQVLSIPTAEVTMQSLKDAEKRPDNDAAVKKLASILGSNGKGGGGLGEELRKLGPGPEDIRRALHETGQTQDAVRTALELRTRQLYQAKDSAGKPIFREGVVEGRTKEVAPGSSRLGETTMESLEYVAAIAYDMLSGDFTLKSGEINDILRDGHHRDAAEKVLADFAKTQVVEKAEVSANGEQLRVLLKHLQTELPDVGNQVMGQLAGPLENLHQAFSSDGRVNVDGLLGDVMRIERVRYQLQERVRQLEREALRLQQEAEHVEPADIARLTAITSELRTMRTQLTFDDQGREGTFWVRMLNAARSGAYDAMTLGMFREQIVRHGAAQHIAEELRRGIIASTAAYR